MLLTLPMMVARDNPMEALTILLIAMGGAKLTRTKQVACNFLSSQHTLFPWAVICF
jgi:hypothetical protein